jgi:hypothetical protein
VTGYTDGTLGDQSYGGGDAWLAKYGPGRKLLWKVQLGSLNFDDSTGVAVDSRGYVYITGYTEGKLGGQYYGGSYDAWVAKYSPSGKLLWKKQLGTPNEDTSFGIAVDNRGNVHITGYTYGKLGGKNHGFSDAWVAKYSPSGKLLWKKQLGTSEIDSSWGIATDSSGNVYLTGDTSGKLGDQRYGEGDAWVAKYDSSGTLLWTQQIGTSSSDILTPNSDISWDIATDNSGNVYFTGWTTGKLGDQQYGDYDGWIAKYDSNGTLLWIRQLGTNEFDTSYDIAADSRGNVYLTGYTYGKLGDRKYGDFTDYDAWVAKYDSSGSLLWTKQIGTAEGDVSNGIATDRSGNVYLTGSTRGKLGDQQYDGGLDAWVAKYKPF